MNPLPEAAGLIVHHIPVCPFSQRLEILLELKGCRCAVEFRQVDITKPRPASLLALTGGPVPLPLLQGRRDQVLRESLRIMDHFEALFDYGPIARSDQAERTVERSLAERADAFANAGYRLVMNQKLQDQNGLVDALLAEYRGLDEFLRTHAYHRAPEPANPFLFDRFGWAEAVFTPLFMRFWFLAYYEDFELPDEPHYERVRLWESACRAHPAAQQVTREEIIKLYYDYALGVGNGALAPGRFFSSFAYEPHWSRRPWPPTRKYEDHASDAALGLCPLEFEAFARVSRSHHSPSPIGTAT